MKGLIAEVRASAPWVVFAEPSSSRNLGFSSKLRPFEHTDVVYAPHLYGAYMDAAYDGAASTLGGSMYWAMDRGGGYSIYDAQGVPAPALLDAIVRPAPVRIAGAPIAWTYDDAARTLTLTWRPDRRIVASTVIATPVRLYPGGVTVECGGCTVEQGDGEVRLGAIDGAEQTAIIAPR